MTTEASTLSTGRGVVIAVEHNRAWIETPGGGRLFFPFVVFKSPGRPAVGDRVVYRQLGATFKRVLRLEQC
jgi:hypothetical protein